MRGRAASLTLAEELLLLALLDARGTLSAGSSFKYVLGGALLAELLLRGRVRVPAEKKKHLALVDRTPTGDPLLDECLDRVVKSRRSASLQTWVTRFAGQKRLRPRLAQGLCGKGILREDEETVLVLFRRRVFPQIEPGPEREIVARMRKAIWGDGGALEARTAVLIALAHRGNVLKNVFARDDLKRGKERLRRIANGDLVDRAVRDAVASVQAAATAAMVAAVAASSSS